MQRELTIDSLAYGGRGVARPDGRRVVFVAGALPGERVAVEVLRETRDYVEARTREVLEASPSRIEPACPLAAAGCAGCCYQHLDYRAELQAKRAQLLDALRRLGRLEQVPAGETVAAPRPLAYRGKIVLHAQGEQGDRRLGYRGADNRTVIDVGACAIARAEINERLAALRAKEGFLDAMREGHHLTLRWTAVNGAVHWINQPNLKESWLKERTLLGELSVPQGCFFQVNPPVADLVVAHVDALLREVRPEIVIDAYAGVGVFALAAAAAGVPEVYGVETDVRAVEAARVNAARLGLDRVRFAARGAASFLKPRLERYRDAKAVLVLDPPRRGLEPGLREALCRRGPPCILYVSCAPDTLSRDLAFLGGGGYVARSVTLFDMFPRTACFETVVELHREADRCAG